VTRTIVDTNYCAMCDEIRDFHAFGAKRRLHCAICDWPLEEEEAVAAAEKSEARDQRKP
jgi:hypothetical protein